MAKTLKLIINNIQVEVEEGATILDACKAAGINVPTLCYLKDVHKYGACRICVVEVEGARNLQASCITPARDGMVVLTNSPKVRKTRKTLYELMLSNHSRDCLNCSRNQSCEFQEFGKLLNVKTTRFDGAHSRFYVDGSVSITRDMSKCILCRRCVTVCNDIQNTNVLAAQNRGFDTEISPSMCLPIGSVNCTFCGQCTVVCPVGALKETDSTEKVWEAIGDKTRRAVVQVAPAVRVALGEEFGIPAGTSVTKRMVTALRRLGFDDVFDTNFGADLTIMEEGTEFLSRVKAALTGGKATLPMITSCSPGWVKYVEHHYPDHLAHLSSCKSPHTMLGAVIKSFYAERIKADPKDLYVVSVMPCTAKKEEIARAEMKNNGLNNVDAVITTRELADMIKAAGLDFVNLPETEFDNPLGMSTGAADIFGLTGGVMEAALRTVYELVTGRELPFPNLHVSPIVGLDQIKEGAIKIENAKPEYAFLNGVEVKIAVTSGLAGAGKLMEQIAAGTSPYHFIEIMGCPGGCITGGGQPRSNDENIRSKRQQALYQEDESKTLRKSHENPYIQALYKDYLGEPNGHKSHELLHTHYTRRGNDNQFTDELFVTSVDPYVENRTKMPGAEPAKKEDSYEKRVKELEGEIEKLKKENADVAGNKKIIDAVKKLVERMN